MSVAALGIAHGTLLEVIGFGAEAHGVVPHAVLALIVEHRAVEVGRHGIGRVGIVSLWRQHVVLTHRWPVEGKRKVFPIA